MDIDTLTQGNIWLALQGQHVIVPNVRQLFPSWKPRIHVEYEKARDEVLNPWIRRWVKQIDCSRDPIYNILTSFTSWVDNDTTCRKFQKAEFGVFAAIICADSPFDRMCTVGKYFAWVSTDQVFPISDPIANTHVVLNSIISGTIVSSMALLLCLLDGCERILTKKQSLW
jgi:hypothetical protein